MELSHRFGHRDHARLVELALIFIIEQQETLMAAIDDLKTALADLTQAVTDNTTEIDLLITKITTPGTSDADIAAATTQITNLSAGIRAELAKAQAAAP